MSANNIFFAHSGGVTSVVNAIAGSVISTARQHSNQIGTVYAGRNGILGALHEELIDTQHESDAAIAALRHTPASAFGSCRYKLKSLEENRAEYQRLIEVFAAHDIGYFIYNGGNDSMDTAHKVWQMSQQMDVPLTCIGLPKTVDNDLPFTDTCPGFGSVAKYVAVSTREAALDVASMAATSTKVFIFEVMGRHAGWIAAAAGLAAEQPGDAPHIILLPERQFDQDAFLKKVQHTIELHGYCVVVASEGIRDSAGAFLSKAGLTDAFGHQQLGGVAPVLANLVSSELGAKNHWAVADYLQRSARHIASATDVEQAVALGKAGIEALLAGKNGIMLTIERTQVNPYSWQIGEAPLENVANIERHVPDEFISPDNMHITQACIDYLQPLIQGEDYPPYQHGIPQYARLQNQQIEQKLSAFSSTD